MDSKPWYKSRTIWLGVLSVLAGVGSLPLGGSAGAAVAIVSGLAGATLRTVTSQPISGTSAAKTQEGDASGG